MSMSIEQNNELSIHKSEQSCSQLFCFTFAGGTASFFDEIERDLPRAIEVIKPEYAGHGARHKEPLYDSFSDLANDMFTHVKNNYAGGDYSLFGYSMGTVTLVEVLKRILASHSLLPAPQHIFLGAHEPHTKKELLGFTEDELDEWVKEQTLKFGTVPEKLINNKTFWRMYLPLYRADYTLLAHYDFERLSLKTKSDIPATIFYSEEDTPLKEMKLWERYFGSVNYHRYEGQHFFIQQHHMEIARVIADKLQISCRGRVN